MAIPDKEVCTTNLRTSPIRTRANDDAVIVEGYEECDGDTSDDIASLYMLVRYGDSNLKRIRQMVSTGRLDPRQPDAHGWTALKYALVGRQWDCFEELLRAVSRADLQHAKKHIGRIVTAIEERATDQITRLVGKRKFIKDIMAHDKVALVVFAIACSCSSDIIRVLIDALNEIDHRYHCGMTPLIVATILGNYNIVEAILTYGPDLTICDELRKSAMSYAVENGCLQCLELLLRTNVRHTGYELAINKALTLAIVYDRCDCLSLLLSAGMANHHDNESGELLRESLLEATQEGSLKSLQLLLDLGADASSANEFGQTPLMFAVIKDHAECFDRLLQHGVIINAVDLDGDSTLMHAVQWLRPEMVPKLLEAGADVNIMNSSSMTAIAMACCSNHAGTLELLLSSFQSSSYYPQVKKHAMAFKLAAKFQTIEALVLLIKYGVFQWDWMDDNEEVSPELISQAAVKSSTRPGTFIWGDQKITLLKQAFYYDNYGTASFLMSNLYLSSYDVEVLPRDVSFINTVTSKGSPQSKELLHQLTSQPWSLQTLSFLAISTAINVDARNATLSQDGAPQPRRDANAMIRSLPLPQQFIDRLLFKSAWSQICVDGWVSIGVPHACVAGLTPVSLMSREAPIWRAEARLPEKCAVGRCSNNHEGFRSRFQLLRHRMLVSTSQRDKGSDSGRTSDR